MSCPWAKIEKPEPVNFADIMSEQVAKDLQDKEEKKLLDIYKDEKQIVEEAATVDDIPAEVLKAITDDSFESDAMIAQMLQMQYDKEYDQELKRTEEKFNGASKVSISFDNYRRVPLNTGKLFYVSIIVFIISVNLSLISKPHPLLFTSKHVH